MSRIVWIALAAGVIVGLLAGPTTLAAEITVDTLVDEADESCTDDCSLRDALERARNGDTIAFDVSGTITLTEGPLRIANDLTVAGPGVDQLTIDGNRSSRVLDVARNVDVEILDLTIRHGNAGGSVGGGIRNFGELTLTRVAVLDNTARQGGGLFNLGSTLTVRQSTIANNLATNPGRSGGGLFNLSELILVNSTVSGNQGRGDGGGLVNGGSLIMIHATVADNAAERGGGIFFDFTVRITVKVNIIKNSIVANSRSGADCAEVLDGADPSINVTGTNLDTDGTCSGFQSVSPSGLNLQPLESDPDRPLPLPVHGLGPGSPAVDAVSDCTDIGGKRIRRDQLGVERPQDGDGDGQARCDVGAFERRSPANPQ